VKEVKLSSANRASVLQEALEVIRGGGVVVYPTETSYGLGADFYNARVVDKIYNIKNRARKFPLPVLVSDLVYATSLVDFSESARRMAGKYWPGPLTLVLPFKYCKWQEHCDDFLALRVSSHPFAKDLVTILGSPLVSTSANIASTGDSYSASDIKKQFAKSAIQPDLFINAGTLPKNPPSTIIKFFNNQMEVLRQGKLKIQK
jgi:L-threonylcarbamoyladenylate synthase